jgi:hypothetical protein
MKNIENKTIILFAAIFLVILLITPVKAASALYFYLNISNPNDTSITATSDITSSSAVLILNTDVDSNCKYSEEKGLAYSAMPHDFDTNYGTTHKATLTDLIDGPFRKYIKCQSYSGNISKELEAIFSVSLPVSAQITFDDGSNLKDGKARFTLTTSKIVGDTPSLSYTTDGIGYKPMPLIGSEKSWEGYIIISVLDENKVCSFKFQARDLEGNLGTEITSGAIFTIDTIPPNALLDIKAESASKGINLTWKSDEDSLTFNIYKSKSPGASYSEFYKRVSGNSYIDKDVSSGNTYYYRISGLDAAGNEGALSREVYAAPSFGSQSTSNGLDLRYVGLVENFLTSIDETSLSINEITSNFNVKEGVEKEIFDYLKLDNAINSAKNSLSSLKSEVSAYKSQTLTREELDKKLNSAQVRLNIIKATMPENLVISNQLKLNNKPSDNDISSSILSIKPGLDYNQLGDITTKAAEYLNKNELQVNGNAYNIAVNYADGTQKTFTLIKKDIAFTSQNSANTTLIEVIPKDIAQSSNDLNVYNKEYDVLKDDPILSFSPNTKQIIYFVKGALELNSIGETKTFVMVESTVSSSLAPLTGYFTFISEGNASSLGITMGIILIAILLVYLFVIKNKSNDSERFAQLKERLIKLKGNIEEGNTKRAFENYNIISEQYKMLAKSEKSKIYSDLRILHERVLEMKDKIMTNKSLNSVFAIFAALILLTASLVFAADAYQFLMQGKNEVALDRGTYASELIRNNPDIDSITYFDEFLNESYGYVNVFGGIGKNFVIKPGEKYEINVKKNTSLIV